MKLNSCDIMIKALIVQSIDISVNSSFFDRLDTRCGFMLVNSE